MLAAGTGTLDPTSPVRSTIEDTRQWFDEVRSTLPKTVEEVQRLRQDQNRLEEKLAATEAHLQRQEADAEKRLQEQLANQSTDLHSVGWP